MSKEDIKQRGYIPDPPKGFVADVNYTYGELKWEVSDCAESYEVKYIAAGDENELTTMYPLPPLTSVSITNLQPCTRYETFINAILDEKYSETATEFATEPRLSVGSTMEVETNTAFESVLVSWPAWNEVSCIENYGVKACIACTDDCTAEETVQKAVGNPFVRKNITGLQGGTNYTLHIQQL